MSIFDNPEEGCLFCVIHGKHMSSPTALQVAVIKTCDSFNKVVFINNNYTKAVTCFF